MTDLTVERRLVKSHPELWSELSEVESLAKHLGGLGEIKITKVEPETTVAWEGEQVSGTVELEQSGWGTKVTFHATVPEPDPPAEPEPEPAAEPERVGFWVRLFSRRSSVEVPSDPQPEVAPDPSPDVAVRVQEILDGTLDSLGQAHHRPFSRG